jgi:hypothetical protein
VKNGVEALKNIVSHGLTSIADDLVESLIDLPAKVCLSYINTNCL